MEDPKYLDLLQRKSYGEQPLADIFQNRLSSRPTILLKNETPTKVFSCQHCEMFKNSFFIKHLWLLLPLQILIFIRITI